VDERDDGPPYRIRESLERFAAVGGGIARDGTVVTAPDEWVVAKNLLAICDRFHCVPSVAEQEEMWVFQLMQMEAIMRPEEGGDIEIG
jgi:hypothetical protein